MDHARKKGRDVPIPRHMAPAVNYVKKLFWEFDRSETLNIPVRAWGNPELKPDACTIEFDGRQGWIKIRSFYGSESFPFNSIGPNDLVKLLRQHELEIALPGEERKHG